MRILPRSTTLAIFAVSVFGFGQAAVAGDDDACTKAPKDQWLTADNMKAKLVEQGYKISKIEFEDGCVEAKVEDKDGKKAELKLDPVTAAIVKIEH